MIKQLLKNPLFVFIVMLVASVGTILFCAGYKVGQTHPTDEQKVEIIKEMLREVQF